jgi:LmbE family N-acetylglucosaminyl deacetylase
MLVKENDFMKTFPEQANCNTESKVVLCVAAHPDDLALCCGGTIFVCTQRGYDVRAIYVTKGEKGIEPGCSPEIRVNESNEACAKLGIERSKVYFGNFPDTRVPDSVDLIRFLEDFYLKARSVYAVFVPSTHEIHQDHRSLANTSITAFRRVPRIFAYESASTTTAFSPTAFADVTGLPLKMKWKALKCHQSQIVQRKMYLEYTAMLRLASFRGLQIGVKYAESFEMVKCLI